MQQAKTTGESSEVLSLATNVAMNVLGYSKDIIQSRAISIKNLSSFLESIITKVCPFFKYEIIITGSKGEGIAKPLESDIDILIVLRNFLCLDRAQIKSDIITIKAISTNSPPGYTKLSPFEMDQATRAFLGFFAEYDVCRGETFLSSKSLINCYEISGKTLAFLYNCLRCRFLPNFMMQSRNLLLGKGNPRDITRLHCIMAILLNKGGSVVMEIEKVRNSVFYVVNNTTNAKQFAKMRDKFEVIYLRMSDNAMAKLSPENFCQSSYIFDVIFEMLKDPSVYVFLCLLLKFLNLDLASVKRNPDLVLKAMWYIF